LDHYIDPWRREREGREMSGDQWSGSSDILSLLAADSEGRLGGGDGIEKICIGGGKGHKLDHSSIGI
jgi:hypothetical protein